MVKVISAPFLASCEGNVGSEIFTPKPFRLDSFEPLTGFKNLLYFDSSPETPSSSIFVKPTI